MCRCRRPVEIVGGALCVTAVLLAWDARPLGAGIALGLAVATKQWGLLAVVPARLIRAHPAG